MRLIIFLNNAILGGPTSRRWEDKLQRRKKNSQERLQDFSNIDRNKLDCTLSNQYAWTMQ